MSPAFTLAMTPEEGAMLERYLKPGLTYVEFGGGGSTALAIARGVARCDTVESDPNWIAKMREQDDLQSAEKAGQLVFHAIDIGEIGDWGMPKTTKKHPNWAGYYLDVWATCPQSPDLVLIDGRFRAACFASTLLACPTSTRILMHDFNRPEAWRKNYQRVLELADIVEQTENLVSLKRRDDVSTADILSVLGAVWTDFA